MKRVRLTHKLIEQTALPSHGSIVIHDEIRCLYVAIYSTGKVCWYWYGRACGKPRRIKLGEFPEMPLEAARAEAKEISINAARGISPQSGRQRRLTEWTLQRLFDSYMELHSKPRKLTAVSDERRFARVFAGWGHRRLADITKGEIERLHVDLEKSRGPFAANKAVEFIKAMYNFAIDKRYFDGPNPAKGIRRFDTPDRDRFLEHNELPQFFAALASLKRQTARDFFLMCLLTGGRRSNVAAMEWEEISFNQRRWTIPRTKYKSKRSTVLPLSEAAISLLKTRLGLDERFVFPGRGKHGHYCCPKEAWSRLLAKSGLTNLRIHDLRRTLGSYEAMTGASMLIIGRSLGQSSESATKIYAQLQMDPVRQALEAATAEMMTAAQQNRGPAKNP